MEKVTRQPLSTLFKTMAMLVSGGPPPPDPALRQALADRLPWRDAVISASESPVELLLQLPVNAAPHDVWEYVRDSSRLNRQLGIPRADFSEIGGRRHGRSAYFGAEMVWQEPPWEWIRDQMLVCRKTFDNGPVQKLHVVYFLEDKGDSTLLWVYYAWSARGRVGTALVQRFNSFLERAFGNLWPTLTHHLEAPQGSSPLYRPRRRVGAEEGARCDQLLDQMREPFDSALVERVRDHILCGDPLDLDRIQVKVLAKLWAVDFETLLRLFLDGTRAGLFTLRWDVTCPHCRGVRERATRLNEIPAESSCAACDVVFSTVEEGRVEVIFRVHDQIRTIRNIVYCAADAGRQHHLVFQLRVPPNTPRQVSVRVPPGRYFLRRRSSDDSVQIQVDDGAPPGQIHGDSLPKTLYRSGPDLTFSLAHTREGPASWTLESVNRGEFLAPGEVLALPQYRDLFSADALAAGVRLEVGTQTILFTDVVGSTQMYRELGDERAFLIVHEHFQTLFGLVEGGGGVVIKTLGDSVMAAFGRCDAALDTALKIQQFLGADGPVAVRVSLNRGPCLAVNLNTGLDYFGSVVNTSAKLQYLAGAGQIALSQDLVEDTHLQSRLGAHTIERLDFRVSPAHDVQRAAILSCPVD
jgi:class 3 adenylate cyclase